MFDNYLLLSPSKKETFQKRPYFMDPKLFNRLRKTTSSVANYKFRNKNYRIPTWHELLCVK